MSGVHETRVTLLIRVVEEASKHAFSDIRTQGPRSMGYGSGVGGMTMEAENSLPSTPDARRNDCTSY